MVYFAVGSRRTGGGYRQFVYPLGTSLKAK
jgi:hypothetical protein